MGVNTGFDIGRQTINEERVRDLNAVTSELRVNPSGDARKDVEKFRAALVNVFSDRELRKDRRVVDCLMLAGSLQEDSPELAMFADVVLAKNMDLLENAIQTGDNRARSYLLKFVGSEVDLKYGDGVREKALNMVGRIGLENSPKMIDDVVNICLSMEVNREKAFLKGVSWLMAMGMNGKISEDMVNSWMTVDEDVFKNGNITGKDWSEVIKDVFVKNIKKIIELQKVEPTLVETLYKEFGITHFGRYPTDLLVKQYREIDMFDVDYGLWVGAYSDNNAAFMQRKELVERVGMDADKLGFRMRVVEARDKVSVVRRLKNLDKKYGHKNKITFLVIAGHGNKTSVQLGQRPGDELNVDDLGKESAQKVKGYYKTGCPVAFVSCSTGIEGGVATKYSNFLGTIAVGPGFVSGGERLNLIQGDDGVLRFDGSFLDVNEGYKEAAVYKDGADYTQGLKEIKDSESEKRYLADLNDPEKMELAWRDTSTIGYILERELGSKAINLIRENIVLGEGLYMSVAECKDDFGQGVMWIDAKITKDQLLEKVNHRSMRFVGEGLNKDLPSSIAEDLTRLEKYIRSKALIEKYQQVVVVIARNNRGRTEVLGSVTMDARELWPENIKKRQNKEQ